VSHDSPGRWGSDYEQQSRHVVHYASIDLLDNSPLCPNYYSLSHTSSGWSCKIRNWDLEGSNDDVNWEILRSHREDDSVKERCPVSWPIENVSKFYRYFKIVHKGPNSDGSFCMGM
jgi:hypothetical protein